MKFFLVISMMFPGDDEATILRNIERPSLEQCLDDAINISEIEFITPEYRDRYTSVPHSFSVSCVKVHGHPA